MKKLFPVVLAGTLAITAFAPSASALSSWVPPRSTETPVVRELPSPPRNLVCPQVIGYHCDLTQPSPTYHLIAEPTTSSNPILVFIERVRDWVARLLGR